MAYALWVIALVHAVDAWRAKSARAAGALALAMLVTLQAALGIWTLLEQAPIALALAHQAGALIVLTLATLHAARLRAMPRPIPAPDRR